MSNPILLVILLIAQLIFLIRIISKNDGHESMTVLATPHNIMYGGVPIDARSIPSDERFNAYNIVADGTIKSDSIFGSSVGGSVATDESTDHESK
jgi:hypothetical protein